MKNHALPSHLSIKVPLGFLNHKWFLYSAVAVLVLAGGTYWFLGTPQYSMWQFKQATIRQDADKAMKFINIDKLMDSIWPKVSSAMMTEATKTEDPFGMLGAMLGSGLIESMKPMIKEQINTGLKDLVSGKSASENPEEDNGFIIAREDLDKLKLKSSKGKVYILAPAEVTGDVEMKYILTRAEDGRYWQITDLDADWSKLFSS